jgi:predicted transcriptional regulator of viral defense system
MNMTQNSTEQSARIDLPYFEPSTGQEQASATTVRRLLQRVLDRFYLHSTAEAPAELVAVIGSLVGGDLLIAYHSALPYVFLNPETQHEKMYQLLLPDAG